MDNTEIVTADGEVIEGALAVLSGGAVAEMSKAEIMAQVETARRFPRSITKAGRNINSLATLDEKAAEECIYALPRGGKPIRGPSIRLAEIVAQQWGNNRVATRVIEVDRGEKVIVAEAVFHDLETNAAVKATVRRRISDRQGRLLNDDMIVVTGNAASSIARRNAILAGVPKAIWRRAYEAAEGVVKGDMKTLAERRHAAISSFGTWGVKPEQVYAALGVNGQDEVTLEHMPTLAGMFNAIKNGEETVESLFANRSVAAGKAFDRVADPLSDKPAPAAGKGVAGEVKRGGKQQDTEAPAIGPAVSQASESGSAEDASNSQAEEGAGQQPSAAPAIDKKHPDYLLGWEGGVAGLRKGLTAELKADPVRLAHFEAGQNDGRAQAARDEDA